MVTLLAASVFATQYATEINILISRGYTTVPQFAIGPDSQFFLVIYNDTKVATKILSEKCSWGYESLSFELKNPAGKITAITRKPKGWDKNAPVGNDIASIGLSERRIDFGDNTWKGFPAGVAGRLDGWKFRAVFAVPAQKLLTEKGFWTGRVESKWHDVVIAN